MVVEALLPLAPVLTLLEATSYWIRNKIRIITLVYMELVKYFTYNFEKKTIDAYSPKKKEHQKEIHVL